MCLVGKQGLGFWIKEYFWQWARCLEAKVANKVAFKRLSNKILKRASRSDEDSPFASAGPASFCGKRKSFRENSLYARDGWKNSFCGQFGKHSSFWPRNVKTRTF